MTRHPPWKQNGIPPMVNFMQIVLVKSWSTWGASHQPAAQILVTHVCPVYLVDELVFCIPDVTEGNKPLVYNIWWGYGGNNRELPI